MKPRQTLFILQAAAQVVNGTLSEPRKSRLALVFVLPHLLKNPVNLSETKRDVTIFKLFYYVLSICNLAHILYIKIKSKFETLDCFY